MNDTVITLPEGDEPLPRVPEIIDQDLDSAPPARAAASDQPDLPEGATLLEDKSVRLTLDYPVTVKFRRGEQTIEEHYPELHMGRLSGLQMQSIGDAVGHARTIKLLAASTGLTPSRASAVFERMDAADIAAVSDVLLFLFSRGRKTGR